MRRLLPDPGPTTVSAQLETYRPWEEPREDRPLVAMNFVATVDGRATIEGRSGPIGSDTDTAMLAGLRTRFDALMIGAGTMRVEQYGPLASKQETHEKRRQDGLAPAPLMVLISGRLDLPWEAPLFEKAGEVLIFTAADTEPPQTAASVEVVRHDGAVNFREAMRHLRQERGIRALLSEGGPHVHEQMQADGLVDDLFLTISPKLSGGEAPRIIEGPLPGVIGLELAWLLEDDGELFARYRRA
jgi:riboflavin-specific deaminase-like protein